MMPKGRAYTLFLEKYGDFTEIQEIAIPEIASGKNGVIIAPTGSGKTEAAILPVLEKIASGRGAGISALYITPLKSLNRDLLERIRWLAEGLGIEIGLRHGDTSQSDRRKQASAPPQLLITTPETLQNLFLSPRIRDHLKNIRFVIVDELHELYSNKRGAQLSVALERIVELSGEFQRIGISATVGSQSEISRFIFGERKSVVLRSGTKKAFQMAVEMPAVPKRRHPEFEQAFALDDEALARIERVSEIINASGAALVFANTRQAVESLGSRLVYLNRLEGGESIGIHHSSLERGERIEIESSFKEGKIKGIISTSSLELGIDIGRIDRVVQYGSPRQVSRLVQRIGRGGHRENTVSKGDIIVGGMAEVFESAAVALAAEAGMFESGSIETGAMDVLVNQLAAMALEYGKVDKDRVFRLLTRAAPYMLLERKAFDEVLAFAESLGLVRTEDGSFGPSSRTRAYFFRCISVIPDSPRFVVRDIVRNKNISTLDDKFVYSYLEEGSTFITKGMPWKVASIEDGVVLVEPGIAPEASVPDWEGEDIPVSRMVAALTADLIRDCKKIERLSEKGTYALAEKFSAEQGKFFSLSESSVFIEDSGEYVLLFVPLGKLANEFIARLIAGVISSESRGNAYLRSTAYGIVIDWRDMRRKPDIEKILNRISTGGQDLLEQHIGGSDLFRYKFVQVAKLFGVLDKKASVSMNQANRLVEFYRGSVVYREAMRDLLKNNLDASAGLAFLSEMRQGKVALSRVVGGSPFSREIIESILRMKEFLSGENPREEEIKAFERKINGRDVGLLCTFCRFEFSRRIDTGEISQVYCARCKSPMVCTFSDGYCEALEKKSEGRKLSRDERKAHGNAMKEAGLVSAYGDRALIALLTYGVGIVTAARVLQMVRREKEAFFTDLINAQKNFVKNGRFWRKSGRNS